MKWNARINLSAARTWEAVADHVMDGAYATSAIPSDARRVVDVGSGGGIPGAIIALIRPEVSVTSLEPVHKKQSFLSAVRRELNATNYLSYPLRDEEFLSHADFAPFDVAISRATFALPEWLRRGVLLIRSGGLVIGMEGAEQHELPEGAVRSPYNAGDKTRSLITWHPGTQTAVASV